MDGIVQKLWFPNSAQIFKETIHEITLISGQFYFGGILEMILKWQFREREVERLRQSLFPRYLTFISIFRRGLKY